MDLKKQHIFAQPGDFSPLLISFTQSPPFENIEKKTVQ